MDMQDRKMLFVAIPSICASSSNMISIYNEEMIVARRFIGFIIFSRKSLGLEALNWTTLPLGYYKLNRDASFMADSHRDGFGNITTQALNFAFLVKEFSVNTDSERLNITFTPSKTSNAYAFVNGIEIVSMPDIYSTTDGSVSIVGLATPFTIDNSTALENVFRLNVGGNLISPAGDTGMLRSWSDDSPYIYGAAFGVTDPANSTSMIHYPKGMPSYVAPVDVYATSRAMGPDPNVNLNYNLTWIFTVDSGFYYLVRLHFCAFEYNKINERVFDIFLNNQTAEKAADVLAWTGVSGVPLYRDYVVLMPKAKGQQDIWLAMHPNVESKPSYYNALLNGLEIFKVSDTTGNLAGPNPIPAPVQKVINPALATPPSSSLGLKNQAVVITGSVVGGITVVCLLCFIVFAVCRRKRQGKDSSSSDGPSGWLPLSLYGNSHSSGSAKTNTTGSYASSIPANLCRHFSFAEIKSATKNFDEALLLGESAEESGGVQSDMDMDMDMEDIPFKKSSGGKDPDWYEKNIADSSSSGMTKSIGGRSLASEDSDGLTPSAVFSQIMNPEGR
ncbi:hypothetical protein NE237_002957 [Protea cynaroides]|uniref:Malectin-like domain-containing protein n=1 Tax=Protea cynaroides TaxID=273540 RepID=A0A9Q0KFT1_9MAGN|nr:hypothetical protein NE237_002957 [Protea cynaroides]